MVYLTNFRPLVAQDSIPARLLPFTLLREGNVDFDEFPWLFRVYSKPYFLNHTRGGHWLSAYAIGAPALVTPLSLPAVWWLRAHQIEDDDVRFRVVTLVMERIGAAALTAASVTLMYLALCQVTAARFAVGVTLVYALGTNTWVVGSQSLLQHGGAAMALAGMSLFLLGPDTWRRALGAGIFASLAVLVRPTMVIFSLLAFVLMLRERRRHLLAFLSLPLAGVAWLWMYNSRLAGLIQGGYHGFMFTAPRLDWFLGLLLSPNRGLFVYTPAAVLALPSVWSRDPERPRWVRYLPAGILGYLLLYSAWKGWWGGNTYGPRFLTDALPALALCAVPTVERLWRTGLGRAVTVTLVAWGVAIQVLGVYFDDNGWNMDLKFGGGPGWRLWSLADLQIVHAATAGWHGTNMLPLLWQTFTDPRPALLRPLPPEDLAGQITVKDPLPLRYAHGVGGEVTLELTNQGHQVWPAFSDYGFLNCRVNYRWALNGNLLEENHAMFLPRNLGAGESLVMRRHLEIPSHPGKYELDLMMVQVLKADRGIFGGVHTRIPVEVY